VQIDADSNGVADVAPYSGMSITYYAAPQARFVGGVSYNFGVIVEGNGATVEEIYEFMQWSLRQTVDIDAGAGTVIGETAAALSLFVGDVLYTTLTTNLSGGGGGVFVDNYVTADTNRIVVTDNTGAERVNPYVATLTISFGANLVADAAAKYWVYFATLPGAGNDFGEAGAQIVEDFDSNPMAGNVSGATSIVHTFDYDGNAQGGRTPGTDADVVVVAIGLTGAQYAPRATVTLTRSTTNTAAAVSGLERTY